MTARKMENPPSTDAAALAEELRRAISTFVRVIRNRTATEKSAQSDVLGLLEREGAMNVAALAQRRNVTHQSMRVAAAQLVADGLIERRPDPDDRRSWLLSLSGKGVPGYGVIVTPAPRGSASLSKPPSRRRKPLERHRAGCVIQRTSRWRNVSRMQFSAASRIAAQLREPFGWTICAGSTWVNSSCASVGTRASSGRKRVAMSPL